MMSDRIGVLLDGSLRRYDRPAEVYRHPGSVAVASFLGAVAVVPRRLFALLGIGGEAAANAEEVGVRAEDVDVRPDPQGAAVVEELLFAGRFSLCRMAIDDLRLCAYTENEKLQRGDRVRVTIKSFIGVEGEC